MVDKQKEFHQFIESSRVFAEPQASRGSLAEQPSTEQLNSQSFNSVKLDGSKINYSRLVEEMRKNNPE